MATIRATCAECGDVEMTSDDVVVRVCVDTGAGTYTFRCPECRVAMAKDAEPRVVELLIASGVKLHRWHLPAELDEIRVGKPISHDDLLDFHRLLTDETRLEAELGRMVEG
ncbi:MAG: hypothetical protein GXY13_02795 [Acidimicrobiales bacterium]|nr:hypothetical protein [Acidimicrobiales bacterium]